MSGAGVSPWLNYAEASEFTRLTPGALRALVARKLIPHARIGPRTVVFARDELDSWLRDRVVGVRGPALAPVLSLVKNGGAE